MSIQARIKKLEQTQRPAADQVAYVVVLPAEGGKMTLVYSSGHTETVTELPAGCGRVKGYTGGCSPLDWDEKELNL